MVEFLVTALVVVAAWLFGRKSGKDEAKVEREREYHDTKNRINAVSRTDGYDVVDRLRDIAERRHGDL